MIVAYIPTAEDVVERLFGQCLHKNYDKIDNSDEYNMDYFHCQDCDSVISQLQLDRIECLAQSLQEDFAGIGGGYFVGKLLDFITNYAKLSVVSRKKEAKFEFVMQYHGEFFYSGAKKFSYAICWLADLVFRSEIDRGANETYLRSKINGK